MVLSAARHAGEARLDDLHANERNRGDGEIRSVGSWHSQPTTIKPVTDGDSRRSVRTRSAARTTRSANRYLCEPATVTLS